MLSRLFGLVLARLLSPAASFLIIIVVARAWGQTDLGHYMTVLAWLAVFQGLSIFGLGEYISKEVGKDPGAAGTYMVHGLFIGLAFALACIGLMTGGAALFGYPEAVREAIMTVRLALPPTVCVVMCHAVFTAFQKIRYVALASALENSLLLIAGLVVILEDRGLSALIWCIVLARSLAAVFNLLVVHRTVVKLHLRIDRQFLARLLAPLAVFGLTGVASQIYLRVDVIMLSKMSDMVTVGLYSSASKLMEICLMLPLAFYVLNLPVAARLYSGVRESARHEIESITRRLFVLVFFVFGLTTFLAEQILTAFYGASFAEASWAFRVLMLAFLIQSAEIVLGMSCQAAGYHRAGLYIVTSRAVLNVLLNLLLIPLWGMLGAAFATLFSAAFSFVIFQAFVVRTLHEFQWIPLIRKPALAWLLVTLALLPFATHRQAPHLLLLFPAGYGLILLALSGLSSWRASTAASPAPGSGEIAAAEEPPYR
jgi:O-antigen/teichoic acid export membrane protein